eukprot:5798481-Prorocentrum_lima.AAC.1
MTSSLVGSEMCIRDREWAPRGFAEAADGEGRAEYQAFQPGAQQLGAVSYTHLTLPTICSV